MSFRRHLAKERARVGGYFWLPCPRCGREFGGHERGGGTLWYAAGSGKTLCPSCPGDYYEPGVAPWRIEAGELRFDLHKWFFMHLADGSVRLGLADGSYVLQASPSDAEKIRGALAGDADRIGHIWPEDAA